MALSHSLRHKRAQLAAARRWADPQTADRIKAEYERARLEEALAALSQADPAGFDDLRRMVVAS